jgi:hypothetical protein
MRGSDGRFLKGQIPHNKKDKIIKVCPTCGRIFWVRPSWDFVVTCSRSCSRKGKPSPWKGKSPSSETRTKMRVAKLGIRGEAHWNWRPWTTQSRRDRVYFKDTMQRRIFERDGYRCVLCSSSGPLQVDHIKGWAEYPELRFDASNCRTLCMGCHYKKTFGRDMPESIKSWGHNMPGIRENIENFG